MGSSLRREARAKRIAGWRRLTYRTAGRHTPHRVIELELLEHRVCLAASSGTSRSWDCSQRGTVRGGVLRPALAGRWRQAAPGSDLQSPRWDGRSWELPPRTETADGPTRRASRRDERRRPLVLHVHRGQVFFLYQHRDQPVSASETAQLGYACCENYIMCIITNDDNISYAWQ